MACARRLLLRPVVLLLATASAPAVADEAPERAARPLAQGVALDDLAGGRLALSELAGGVTVVNFWATWCLPCRYELPLLQKVHDRFKDEGLSVVAIAVDDARENVVRYQRRRRFTFPVLFDGSGEAKAIFGVRGVPETYVVGRDGRLIPFRDPATGERSVRIDDPTVWDGEAIAELLARAVARPAPE